MQEIGETISRDVKGEDEHGTPPTSCQFSDYIELVSSRPISIDLKKKKKSVKRFSGVGVFVLGVSDCFSKGRTNQSYRHGEKQQSVPMGSWIMSFSKDRVEGQEIRRWDF